jgi:hypothetical protein
LILLRLIAGLDPAIQESRMNAADFAHRLDCRVKPGNDTVGEAGQRTSGLLAVQ